MAFLYTETGRFKWPGHKNEVYSFRNTPLNTMISPNVDASLAANGVRENEVACKREEEEYSKRKRRSANEENGTTWKRQDPVDVTKDKLIGSLPAFGKYFNISFEFYQISFEENDIDPKRRFFLSLLRRESGGTVISFDIRHDLLGRIWTHFDSDKTRQGGTRKLLYFNRDGQTMKKSFWNQFNIWTEQNSEGAFAFIAKVNGETVSAYYDPDFLRNVSPMNFEEDIDIYAGPGGQWNEFCPGQIRNILINTSSEPWKQSIGFNLEEKVDVFRPAQTKFGKTLFSKIFKKRCFSSQANQRKGEVGGEVAEELPPVDIFVNPNRTEDMQLVTNYTVGKAKSFFRSSFILLYFRCSLNLRALRNVTSYSSQVYGHEQGVPCPLPPSLAFLLALFWSWWTCRPLCSFWRGAKLFQFVQKVQHMNICRFTP